MGRATLWVLFLRHGTDAPLPGPLSTTCPGFLTVWWAFETGSPSVTEAPSTSLALHALPKSWDDRHLPPSPRDPRLGRAGLGGRGHQTPRRWTQDTGEEGSPCAPAGGGDQGRASRCGHRGPLPGSAGRTQGQHLLGRPDGEGGGSEVTQQEAGARSPCPGSPALVKSTPITLSIQHGGHPGTGRLRHGMRSVVAFEAKCHPQAGLSSGQTSCLNLPSAGATGTLPHQTDPVWGLGLPRSDLGSEDECP